MFNSYAGFAVRHEITRIIAPPCGHIENGNIRYVFATQYTNSSCLKQYNTYFK